MATQDKQSVVLCVSVFIFVCVCREEWGSLCDVWKIIQQLFANHPVSRQFDSKYYLHCEQLTFLTSIFSPFLTSKQCFNVCSGKRTSVILGLTRIYCPVSGFICTMFIHEDSRSATYNKNVTITKCLLVVLCVVYTSHFFRICQ